jgi:hypothetical protein
MGKLSASELSPPLRQTDRAFGEILHRETWLTGRMCQLIAAATGTAAGSLPGELAPDEAMVARCSLAVAGDGRPGGGDLDDALFGAAVSILGERRLYELVVVVGYCLRLALQQRVFEIGQ